MDQSQAIEVSSHQQVGERTPAERNQLLTPYDSDDKGENDPMVSQAISPFAIPAKPIVPKTRAQAEIDVLIDSGCTQCLINLLMVIILGI